MLYRNKKEKDYHEGKWNGLGGKLEAGESPEQALIREVKEESGLDVNTYRLRGHITFPDFDGIDDWYIFIYTVDQFEGQLIENPPEGELHWIPEQEVQELNLWPGDRVFLPWVLGDGPIFTATFTYEEGVFVGHQVQFHE